MKHRHGRCSGVVHALRVERHARRCTADGDVGLEVADAARHRGGAAVGVRGRRQWQPAAHRSRAPSVCVGGRCASPVESHALRIDVAQRREHADVLVPRVQHVSTWARERGGRRARWGIGSKPRGAQALAGSIAGLTFGGGRRVHAVAVSGRQRGVRWVGACAEHAIADAGVPVDALRNEGGSAVGQALGRAPRPCGHAASALSGRHPRCRRCQGRTPSRKPPGCPPARVPCRGSRG